MFKMAQNVSTAAFPLPIEQNATCCIMKSLHMLKTFLQTADPELEGASVLDVEVTCDGTWSKRGYTSLYGCVFVVSVDTGKC